MADDDATLAMPEPHFLGGIARQHVCKAIEWDTAPEMALAQHGGEQRFEPGTTRRRAPDAAGLAGEIAVDMVGRNRIDCSIGNAGPERFTIAGLAQRWINFTDVAALEADIVCQIVRAGFDGDAAAAGARGERRLQRRRRCGVNDIEPTITACAARPARCTASASTKGGRDAFQLARPPLPSGSAARRRSRSTQAISMFSGCGQTIPPAAAAASHRRNKKPSSMSGRPNRFPSPPRLFMKILKEGAPRSRA